MTIRHMKIFLTLCECSCNTTRAAQKLHMTQPAVSLALHELESYYGIRLFDRIGRRLSITDAGINLKKYASHIIMTFDDMEKELKNWDSFGILRIGASITIGSQFLPSYIKVFKSICPDIKIYAKVASAKELHSSILNNTLDIALTEGSVYDPNITVQKYMSDFLTVICPADGRFSQGDIMPLEEFKRQDFLLRERGSGTREEFEKIIENAGFSVEPIWESISTTAIVNAVINGLGVAVLPYRMVKTPIEKGLVVSVGVESLDFSRSFFITYHRQKFLSKAAHSFIDLCMNFEMDYPIPTYSALY